MNIISGCTKSLSVIRSGENLIIPFRVIITRPGVFNFNCLRFQLGDLAKLEKLNVSVEEQNTLIPAFDEDELIPLQISFVVTHVCLDEDVH